MKLTKRQQKQARDRMNCLSKIGGAVAALQLIGHTGSMLSPGVCGYETISELQAVQIRESQISLAVGFIGDSLQEIQRELWKIETYGVLDQPKS